MSRMIFLETFPHTGTWFMLFFLHKHPDVGGYMPTYQLPLALAGVPNPREVLGGPNETPPLPEQLAPRGQVTVVHTHCQGVESCAWEMLHMKEHGTLFMLRDPLLILASWKQSVPYFNMRTLARFWRRWCLFLPQFEKTHEMCYFPIDWLETQNASVKAEYLKKVLGCFRLSYSEHVEQTANGWNKVGGSPKTGYRADAQAAYEARDLSFFEKTIPDGVKVLRDDEALMRPFLERWYKDLIWWS